jgi:peptidyl-tRNA hydrolase, PTH1 family
MEQNAIVSEISTKITKPIKLIVGLGNIGDEYLNTRHNVAWWLIDRLDKQYNGIDSVWKNQKHLYGFVNKLHISKDNLERSIFLLKPSTYMNNSGMSVYALAKFYKIHPEQILVIHDELDIPVGKVKLKQGGSSGGHNGLKSIDEHLGSKKYWRLRLGINHPRNSTLPTIARQSVADYVLHAPSKEDASLINRTIQKVIEHIPIVITGDMEAAMMNLHII